MLRPRSILRRLFRTRFSLFDIIVVSYITTLVVEGVAPFWAIVLVATVLSFISGFMESRYREDRDA